tara:strand:+ start:198 stop:365 length:168 start_codon:yes stop_codon:yes gene_type:complete
MDLKMLIDMIARMTREERENLITEMDKRFPNLVDELGFNIGVTQQERDMQMEMDI